MVPEERLRRAPAPEGTGARERARRVVLAAPVAQRRRRLRWLPFALVLLGAAAIPSADAIADWVSGLVGSQPPRTVAPPPEPRLARLPAAGRVLVTGPEGAWSIAQDGTRVRLGDYSDASWSPRGVFIAAAAGDELRAIEPDGAVRWTLASPGPVRAPVWSPTGYRIAYRAGRSLRVVAGDGSGDRRLVSSVAPIAPAWRPGAGRELALVRPDGAVELWDADAGRRLWREAGRAPCRVAVLWLGTDRLIVVRARSVALYAVGGDHPILLHGVRVPGPLRAAALTGDGRLALAAGSRVSTLTLPALGDAKLRLTAAGRVSDLVAAPLGRKLLVTSAAARQWFFLPLGHHAPTTAATVRGFTHVTGWETQPLASVGLADGRRIALTARWAEGRCLVISGVDELERRCGAPWVGPADLKAGFVVQRSASHPVETYGSASAKVVRVVMSYVVDGVAATRDATLIPVDGVVPYGYFLAELPATATDIRATGYDARGTALETDAYGAGDPQAAIADPDGTLERYADTPWATGEPGSVAPASGDRDTSFDLTFRSAGPGPTTVVQASSQDARGTCRRDAEAYANAAPAGAPVTVALEPAGEGAHLGWCPGHYTGVAQVSHGGPVLERFSFSVTR